MKIDSFLQLLWQHYDQHSRTLPWRYPEKDGSFDGYKILVSEMMLQQTQVSRVTLKYQAWLQRFPDVDSLARAQWSEVLQMWVGLGYNRRAQYTQQAAQHLRSTPQPWTIDQLQACKGIGPNTAAAICVYAYNQPHVFIETNIRTVFIHHFFPREKNVSDAMIANVLMRMLAGQSPREFYWALMDYGSYLKRQGRVTAARQSQQYHKQSPFRGSKREIRGQILKQLAMRNQVELQVISELIKDERLEQVIDELVAEGLVQRSGKLLTL